MTLTYIAGTYRIIGASPDGDSVRFYPTRPSAFADAHINVKANATGGVQLRLDAIDALEIHYTPPSGHVEWSQPAKYGDGAATALLDLLGFSEVTRDEHKTVTSSTPAEATGYIFTGFGDKYGRAVAMAYPGQREGSENDGDSVYLGVEEMQQSVNYRLLAAGTAYPTFYSRLYYDLRDGLAAAAVDARTAHAGVWGEDATLPGFTLTSRSQLSDDLVILPKLFRRLAEYLSLDESGSAELSGFGAFLEAQADLLYVLPTGQMTHLDTLVEVSGQEVRLLEPPEQLVFMET